MAPRASASPSRGLPGSGRCMSLMLALFVGFELAKLDLQPCRYLVCTEFAGLRRRAYALGNRHQSSVSAVVRAAFGAELERAGLECGARILRLDPVRRRGRCCSRAGNTTSFSASAWRPELLLYTVSPDTLFVSSDWGILRACFSFFAGCLVYDLRLRSGDRLKAPNLWEAGCLAVGHRLRGDDAAGRLAICVSAGGHDHDLRFFLRPGRHLDRSAELGAAKARPVVLLDLHDPHLHIRR